MAVALIGFSLEVVDIEPMPLRRCLPRPMRGADADAHSCLYRLGDAVDPL